MNQVSVFVPLQRVLFLSRSFAMRSINTTLQSTIRSPMFWMFCGALLAAVASNLTAGDPTKRVDTAPSESANSASDTPKIVREGARIESKIMRAKLAGENIVWEADDSKKSFDSLENLALERVLQAVHADGSERPWIVTGTITEFKGRNFILLERASRAPRVN